MCTFWHVVWNQCLFRVVDLMCLAWRTRFDHFIDVMIDTTPDWGAYLCSPVPMFPGTYIPRYRCSPNLYSPVPMFPGTDVPRTYVPGTYVPRYLYSPVPMFPEPMFPGTYVPRYRCSPNLCSRYLCSPVPMFPDLRLTTVVHHLDYSFCRCKLL